MANNEAKNDMETTEVMEEEPLEGKEIKDYDTSEEKNSLTVLRKKLKFYKEKVDVMEDMLLERIKELKEERAKFNAEKKKWKEEIKKLKEERDYYIDNADMYQKLKIMKEDMELSIKIHKLRKEVKKWKKSNSKKESQSPKVLVQENNGVDQRGRASRDQSEQSSGNRKGKKGNDKNKKDKKKQIKNKKNKKNDTDRLKIQEENLNIISINARGFASKRKSIEEILKNENVDIAIVSELSGKNIHTIAGYKHFIKAGGHMHGLAIFVRNCIAKRALRIHDESDLEIVHLRLSSTVPALDIIGTYLQVESRQTVENVNRVWNLYTERVQHVLDRGEALLCMGDFNRPLQAKRLTHGTKLLNEWLKDKNIFKNPIHTLKLNIKFADKVNKSYF